MNVTLFSFDLMNLTFINFDLVNVTSGSFDADCGSGGSCWKLDLSGRPLWQSIYCLYCVYCIYTLCILYIYIVCIVYIAYTLYILYIYIVLSGKEMSNSFNKLLITLTIFDTTFIVFMVIDYTGFRGNS